MEKETRWNGGAPMTKEERQKLVNSLKNYQGYDRELNKLVHEAADELERLAALAQSDAEPVAWQVRAKGSPDWYIWQGKGEPSYLIDREFYEDRPLYSAPPRPDASAVDDRLTPEFDRLQAKWKEMNKDDAQPGASAGLIEAAEGKCPVCASWVKFRARAPDRSGK